MASAAHAAGPATRFSRLRFALLLVVGVYPLITGILYVVFPLTEGWALWQRTMVVVPLMVVSMIWGLIPAVQTLFRGFLNPPMAP
jgi:antibiotic biosynthesis monooxygenase (ABM) superfamily enzyme